MNVRLRKSNGKQQTNDQSKFVIRNQTLVGMSWEASFQSAKLELNVEKLPAVQSYQASEAHMMPGLIPECMSER